MSKKTATPSPSDLIDSRIEELGDWRGELLASLRGLIRKADPDVVEEWKWRGVPVWSHDGILCTGETYKTAVKVTFAKGASIDDPAGLFNASLDGKVRRAIDFHEGDRINESAFKALIRSAISLNQSPKKKPARPVRRAVPHAAALRNSDQPKLLSGGNPQIAKADGDAPVQAFIAAMPGWKQDVGRYLDRLIVRTVPGVRKAVRWNTPFYGIDGQGWFLGFHCITKYVKVAFFKGASLRPPPPVESKQKDVRYLHIYETERPAEAALVDWIRQAARLPGDPLF